MDLKTRLFSELRGGDDGLAEAAAARIAAMGEGALPELEGMLQDGNEEERWWAIRALAEMKGNKAQELLLRGLNDPSSAVRQCAALAFTHRPDLRAAPDLVQLLEDDQALTRRLAGDAMAALGGGGVPLLLDVLETGPTRARVEAARALARVGDQRAVAPLYHLLEDESALLTYWAEDGLERMGIGMVFYKPGPRG